MAGENLAGEPSRRGGAPLQRYIVSSPPRSVVRQNRMLRSIIPGGIPRMDAGGSIHAGYAYLNLTSAQEGSSMAGENLAGEPNRSRGTLNS